VLLGNGDGSFQPPAFTALSITFSLSFVQTIPADFNGDGKLDLAVTNTYYPSVTVWILLGNGDGTFTQGASLAPGDTPTWPWEISMETTFRTWW